MTLAAGARVGEAGRILDRDRPSADDLGGAALWEQVRQANAALADSERAAALDDGCVNEDVRDEPSIAPEDW